MGQIDLPIAHAEGKLVVREARTLDKWEGAGQIALCYRKRAPSKTEKTRTGAAVSHKAASGSGRRIERTVLPYPDNPNGSVANIAGLCDPTGRVLGLMPHPERFIHATQHPQWTRLRLEGLGDGLRLFRNAVEYFG